MKVKKATEAIVMLVAKVARVASVANFRDRELDTPNG
jgi:hypothetical protein